MNPFDLRGPEFLLFYAVLGAAVVAIIRGARRSFESGTVDGPLVRDYLEIAYLRGGPGEALRVAAISLIDRGLIAVVDGTRLQATDAKALAAKRVERLIVTKCQDPIRASDLFADVSLQQAATEECAPALINRGLLPDEGASARRLSLWGVATFVLVAIAGIKIAVALSRGRSNIGLLVLEAIAFVVIGYRVTQTLRTAAGDEQLSNLRSLFAGLRDRASGLGLGSGSDDVAFLAAVFGAAAVPPRFGLAKLFPRAKTSSSSCGSSCGSGASSGSSCGSSCGGGGGGGGCGGCGS